MVATFVRAFVRHLHKSRQIKKNTRSCVVAWNLRTLRSLQQQGHDSAAGFEVNGGFLLQTPQAGSAALPTRDSTLPILAMAKKRGNILSALPQLLPQRFTQSGHLQNAPTALSHQFIQHMARDASALQAFVQFAGSQIEPTDAADGLRITLHNHDIVHIRPSGNAPELRCYTEAGTARRAQTLLTASLTSLSKIQNQKVPA